MRFLLLFVVSLHAAEKLEVNLADDQTLATRLSQGLVPVAQRESTIAGMFRDAGCTVELQKVSRKANNIICTLPGTSPDPPILVGAHYDFVPAGQGIIDDWSGTSLLVSLYQALKPAPRRHTFIFIAFASEESGLEGSRHYVRSLPKDQSIRAFVNLECLGTAVTKAWVSRSTPDLLDRLARVAATLQLKVEGVNVDKVGDDDTHPFKDARIPVLSLHSLDVDTIHLIHSRQDRVESISLPRYAESYKLIAFYLAYLDSASRP